MPHSEREREKKFLFYREKGLEIIQLHRGRRDTKGGDPDSRRSASTFSEKRFRPKGDRKEAQKGGTISSGETCAMDQERKNLVLASQGPGKKKKWERQDARFLRGDAACNPRS